MGGVDEEGDGGREEGGEEWRFEVCGVLEEGRRSALGVMKL